MLERIRDQEMSISKLSVSRILQPPPKAIICMAFLISTHPTSLTENQTINKAEVRL